MAEFGEKLKQAREAKGYTQQTLADMVYVTRQTISRYETGERYPDIITLKKLSSILDVTSDFLLADEEVIKVAEKNPVVENPIFNNIAITMYTLIASSQLLSVFHQLTKLLSGGEFKEAGLYYYSSMVIQIVYIVLFMFGLVCVLKDKMTPKKTGYIMTSFMLLECAQALKYYKFDIKAVTVLLSAIYVIGAAVSYLFFIKKKNNKSLIAGIIGVSFLGIFRQGYSVYFLLINAKSFYSISNTLVAIVFISIYALFIYQTFALESKRSRVNEIVNSD